VGVSSSAETVTEHQIRVKEKELKNAQAQVELYKRELHGLQAKVDDLSGVDRLMQLESRLRDGIQEKSDLERKVKELERQHKD
jgi:predicted RNase H-like nuclease (RuvC/YqgF family)